MYFGGDECPEIQLGLTEISERKDGLFSGFWNIKKGGKAMTKKPNHDFHKDVHKGIKIDDLSIKGEWTLSEAIKRYCPDPNTDYII